MSNTEPELSDTDLAVKVSKELEGILQQKFNAEGRGLHEKASSIQHLLPNSLVEQLKSIARIRNKIIHEDGFKMDFPTRQRFIRNYEEAKQGLNQIQAPSKLTINQRPDPLAFTIPESLKTFSTGIYGIFKIALSSMTGEIVDIQERNSNETVKWKIWLKSNNGNEHYFEFNNPNFLARRGHIITIFLERKNSKILAIHNYQMEKILYFEDNIKELLSPATAVDTVLLFGGGFVIYIFAMAIANTLKFLVFPIVLATIASSIIFALLLLKGRKRRIKAIKQHINNIIHTS